MRTTRGTIRSTLSALAIAVLASGLTGALTASPAQAHAPAKTRIVAHFDLAAGQLPENIVLEPDGTADVTFAAARQVASVSTDGRTRILATMPLPADGGKRTPVLKFALTTGIARAHDGTLYFLYASGSPELTGLWRLTPGGAPNRIAALPADGLPNGLALDEPTGRLYISDSVLGEIFTVPVAGGRPAVWSAAPALGSTGFLGVNGLKLHGGAVWVSNLDRGTLLRIPFRAGHGAGTPQVRATGLAGIDDFAFTGHGDQVLATRDPQNTVVRIEANGTWTTVLTAADGLQNPTSVAVRADTAYVPSAAYSTKKDPNLLLARVS